MNFIEAPYLKQNDTIGFLSLCGVIEDYNKIETAKNFFKNLGYKVKISDTTYSKYNYLCAKDEIRLKAFYDFIEDDEINAIFLTRGGYGALHLLKKLDCNIITKHPKIIAGYSDVTALLLYIYKQTGLITYHTPMPYSDFGEPEVSKIAQTSFLKVLSGNLENIIFDKNATTIYKKGTAKGILWGGNLTTIASMVGLKFIPEKDFVFFFEDINEPVYKIDRCLTQLLNLKDFTKNLKGIIVGNLTGIDNMQYFDELMFNISNDLNIPTSKGLQIGHIEDNLSIPIGKRVTFVTDEGIFY